MNIVPITRIEDAFSSFKQGTLINIKAREISDRLGFRSPFVFDEEKSRVHWCFLVDGVDCAIWDYYGSGRTGSFSFYGPTEIFDKLFPGHVRKA